MECIEEDESKASYYIAAICTLQGDYAKRKGVCIKLTSGMSFIYHKGHFKISLNLSNNFLAVKLVNFIMSELATFKYQTIFVDCSEQIAFSLQSC
jgi:hypothetical protein